MTDTNQKQEGKQNVNKEMYLHFVKGWEKYMKGDKSASSHALDTYLSLPNSEYETLQQLYAVTIPDNEKTVKKYQEYINTPFVATTCEGLCAVAEYHENEGRLKKAAKLYRAVAEVMDSVYTGKTNSQKSKEFRKKAKKCLEKSGKPQKRKCTDKKKSRKKR